MKLVVGLGNPGEKYAKTRHNVGFMVIDEIIRRYIASPRLNKKLGATLYFLDKERLILRPHVFMNSSGGPVANIARFYKIKPEDLLVGHDDVDLDFGVVKQQFARGSAGHKGVQSVIEKLGTDKFGRVRIGVGRPPVHMGTDAYVLQNFSNIEKEKLPEIISTAVESTINWLGQKVA